MAAVTSLELEGVGVAHCRATHDRAFQEACAVSETRSISPREAALCIGVHRVLDAHRAHDLYPRAEERPLAHGLV